MPKGKRGKRKKDPLELRFRMKVRPDIARTLTAERYNEVYRDWVETGELPEGFFIPANASEWKNPARRGSGANWRTGNNAEAIKTLLARSLPAVRFRIEKTPQAKRRFAPVSGRRRPGKESA